MKAAMCMLAAMIAALPLAAQTPGYAAAPGPLPVTSEEYKFPSVILPTIPYPVDVWARIWYPEGLPGGPYPLVLLLHGNHGVCRMPNTQIDVCPPVPPICPAPFQQTPQHAGYDYVSERLASHGYIVASVNANAINCRANAIPERGRLVQEHLRRWGQWNSEAGAAPFGAKFSAKVNLQNIGLMGHSRGGEGVLAAYNFNRQEDGAFGIKAVFEISPVDFGRVSTNAALAGANPLFNADGVAFSVVLSGCDFDVLDNQGMRVFDRAMYLAEPLNPSIKSQQYVWGVNHNFFNSEWTTENTLFGCTDLPIITTRAPQQEVGAVYLMGFMRMVLGGEDYKSLFTGDAPPPPSVSVPIDIAFTESPSATLMVDNFSDPKAPGVNRLGGSNTTVNLNVTACNAARCSVPPLIWFHDPATIAAKIEWPGEQSGTPAMAVKLTADGSPVDISKFRYLSFRVAVEFDNRNPANPGTQDFSVQLKMGSTSTTSVAAAKYRNIPFPAGLFRKSVMKTIRIPLADFGGLDRSKASEIDFIFDRVKTGAIFLSDIEFTP